MEKIVAADRNRHGKIISFQTSSGRVISYRKALEEMQAGILEPIFHSEMFPIESMNSTDIAPDLFNDLPPIY